MLLNGDQNEDDPSDTAVLDDVYSQFKFEIGNVYGSNPFNGLIY